MVNITKNDIGRLVVFRGVHEGVIQSIINVDWVMVKFNSASGFYDKAIMMRDLEFVNSDLSDDFYDQN